MVGLATDTIVLSRPTIIRPKETATRVSHGWPYPRRSDEEVTPPSSRAKEEGPSVVRCVVRSVMHASLAGSVAAIALSRQSETWFRFATYGALVPVVKGFQRDTCNSGSDAVRCPPQPRASARSR